MITHIEFIQYQIREIKRELLFAISGLDPEDLEFTGPNGHLPVGWIVQHIMSGIDYTIIYHITGHRLLTYPAGIDKYPIDPPPVDYVYPSIEELQKNWLKLLEHVETLLQSVDEHQLQSQSATGIEPLVESFLRTINHANSHIRGIWCLLIQMGKMDKWPGQPSWMPDKLLLSLRSEFEEESGIEGSNQSHTVKKLAKKYAPAVLRHDNRSLWETCEDLMESQDEWQQMIACEWVSAAVHRTTREDFYTFERWLNQYINSRYTCDFFCTKVIYPYIEKDQSVLPRIQEWSNSKNKWVCYAFVKISSIVAN